MSKKAGTVTTTFAWDESGSLPLLIAAGTIYYAYGPGGAPIEQIDTANANAASYLLSDRQGSTRIITGASGTVTGTYAYGSYGAVTRHTGSATTALQYDGQYADAESGLQYLRARYYNPSTGQFLTLDPVTAISLSRYGYANGNPANLVDPSGLCPLCLTALIGGTVGGVIGGLSAGYTCITGDMSGGDCLAAVGGGVLGGAVSGACTGFTGNFVGCGALGGAIGAGATALADKYALNDDVSWTQVGVDTVLGGVGGALGGAAHVKLFGKGEGPVTWKSTISDESLLEDEFDTEFGAIWGTGQTLLDKVLFPEHPRC
jgi:RHS repeat-associated protein